MEITEVRIKLTSGKNEKLRAFCSITIDNDFVIRDLKVIEGAKGAFVAMPSRKLMARCPSCSGKNHYRAPYCNECGARLSPEKLSLDGRRKLHADVAHPINSGCRESIQQHVLAHYQEEKEKSKDPNYRPVDLDDFDDVYFEDESEITAEGEGPRGERDTREAVSGPRSSRDYPRESDHAREQAAEESEWEEETRTESGATDEERELDPAFGSAEDSRAPGGEVHDRRSVGASAGADGGSPDRSSGGLSGGGSSIQQGGERERGGSRQGGPSRPRSGGSRRRGREPRRDGGRLGERDRSRESGENERSTTGVGGEKSPLAVDFDDLGPGRRRGDSGRRDSGRRDSGRRDSGRRDSGRGDSVRRDPGRRDSGRGDSVRRDPGRRDSSRPDSVRPDSSRQASGSSSGGVREARRRDEANEPRFGDQGRERGADAAASADRRLLPEGRIPERRLVDEVDVEPEDNFGAGLFS